MSNLETRSSNQNSEIASDCVLDDQVLGSLRELMGGELDKLVVMFISAGDSKCQQLNRTLLTDDNSGQIEFIAHALKGSAGNMGANNFARLAADLEMAAFHHETGKYASLLKKINAEWQRVELALKSL